jgi:hypothetical protein
MTNAYNMNNDMILISELPYGKTTLEVKIGRHFQEVKIDKNAINSSVTMKGYSVPVKNDAVIDRAFLESIGELWEALRLVRNFKIELFLM